MANETFKVGRDRPQGAEIIDEDGPVALVYGETRQEARDRAERIADLLNEHGGL